MAVALFEATDFGKPTMTRSKTLIVLALLAATVSTAQAGDWTNSGMYNGYGANMNQTSSYQLRDGNGNLTMVDGRPVSAQYSQGSGAQYAGGELARAVQ